MRSIPWDFPPDRHPVAGPGQTLVTEDDFVPAQNAYGGFVYGGATMAYTAAYWVLHALRPRVIAVFRLRHAVPRDRSHAFLRHRQPRPFARRHHPAVAGGEIGATDGAGRPSGLRDSNLSTGPSRLVFPRCALDDVAAAKPHIFAEDLVTQALSQRGGPGLHHPVGPVWEELHRFDAAQIDRLDALWLATVAA